MLTYYLSYKTRPSYCRLHATLNPHYGILFIFYHSFLYLELIKLIYHVSRHKMEATYYLLQVFFHTHKVINIVKVSFHLRMIQVTCNDNVHVHTRNHMHVT